MQTHSARIARAACDKFSTPDKPRFVAGALGPTPKTASISPDVNDPGARNVDFEQLRAAYYEQTEALVEGGADVILVETIFDTLNAKAGIKATLEAGDALGRPLPLMISMTLTDLSGRNLSGHTVEAFWASVRHAKPITIAGAQLGLRFTPLDSAGPDQVSFLTHARYQDAAKASRAGAFVAGVNAAGLPDLVVLLAGVALMAVAPNLFEQFFAGQHLAGSTGEFNQQIEFQGVKLRLSPSRVTSWPATSMVRSAIWSVSGSRLSVSRNRARTRATSSAGLNGLGT